MKTSDIKREKERLPRGWGRFGRALERIGEIGEPDELLLISCVGVSEVAATAGFPLSAAFGETNAVLAVTNKRLIAVGTGLLGRLGKTEAIPLEDVQGVEVESERKRHLRIDAAGGTLRVKSMAKSTFPEFVQVLREQVDGRRAP